jgi:hypothetical protein
VDYIGLDGELLPEIGPLLAASAQSFSIAVCTAFRE